MARKQKALAMFETSYAQMVDTLGVRHKTTIFAMGRLASLYKKMGKSKLAVPLLEKPFNDPRMNSGVIITTQF